MGNSLVTIRADFREVGFGVPVGEDWYFDAEPLQSRWIDDDKRFEVLHNGEWKEAHSIDWEPVE